MLLTSFNQFAFYLDVYLNTSFWLLTNILSEECNNVA